MDEVKVIVYFVGTRSVDFKVRSHELADIRSALGNSGRVLTIGSLSMNMQNVTHMTWERA